MKIHHLEKRLRKVEQVLQCEPDETLDKVFALLWFAVAYYLGEPSRHEKPIAAYARALGYASESELNRALEDNDRELWQRSVKAEMKLYAKFDHNCESDGWEGLTKALLCMQSGLPKSYTDQIARVVNHAKISLNWMRNESDDTAAYIRLFA
jgi:hypothetical protein